jgi:hypothetical protein
MVSVIYRLREEYIMWHDNPLEKCYNHKDRDGKFYEDQSGLYFCADCKQGLKNASERDLFLMTHSEKEALSEPARSPKGLRGATALSDEELKRQLKEAEEKRLRELLEKRKDS